MKTDLILCFVLLTLAWFTAYIAGVHGGVAPLILTGGLFGAGATGLYLTYKFHTSDDN